MFGVAVRCVNMVILVLFLRGERERQRKREGQRELKKKRDKKVIENVIQLTHTDVSCALKLKRNKSFSEVY